MEDNFNYPKICADLISDLKEREKEVISRRFALNGLKMETLESIGQDFGVSRERVRQIQKVAIEKIKPKLSQYQKVLQYFREYFKKFGNLRKEEIALAELGGKNWEGEEDKPSSSPSPRPGRLGRSSAVDEANASSSRFATARVNEVYFLLSLQKPFQRLGENNDFYSFWLIDKDSLKPAKETINFLFQKLQKLGKPLTKKELSSFLPLEETVWDKRFISSILEISKKIQKNPEGLYGLKDWPEINPRGIKDKAYLVFKKIGKPLHFTDIAKLIEGSHLPTVHNELIKDSRFVLVGRGIYALSEWGYTPGQVKEVIWKILKESEKPLKKEEILEKVLSQRLVKENTILLNLSNKKYFSRDSQGRYRPKSEVI